MWHAECSTACRIQQSNRILFTSNSEQRWVRACTIRFNQAIKNIKMCTFFLDFFQCPLERRLRAFLTQSSS